MFRTDIDTVELTGRSGKKYTFKMCAYDTMESIDNAVKSFPHSGLYIFAYRFSKTNDPRSWYSIKYIGETGDYSTRDYSNHHKKEKIIAEGANSWGYCVMTLNEQQRKEIEADLVSLYNPPCNDRL